MDPSVPVAPLDSDSAEEFAASRRIAVDGTSLAYEEQGTGPAVVFVHGGLSDLRMWRTQLAGVAAAGYRAITYSRRGTRRAVRRRRRPTRSVRMSRT